ncbi:MAG: hypothetical protein KDA41_20390, partial [Planctomycetales bacterium]|nr:hypothetical protein [Planctomycetales bacterium]
MSDHGRRSASDAPGTALLAAALLSTLIAATLPRLAAAQGADERPKPENYDQWRDALAADAATDAALLETLPGFEVELLRSAQADEGSWISMAFDPQGRLTISREDQGLLRLIVPGITIDPRDVPAHPPTASDEDEEQAPPRPFDPFLLRSVEDTLKECRGLLYAYGALYANANNSKGLYRLADRNNDGRFEEVELLHATPGGVGHGRNDLTLGPDGAIYSIHGNDVRLPEDFDGARSPYRHYEVDALLPCEWNKYLFNAGATVPAGHVIRTDPQGKTWDLIAGGFRNPYGIAFNADGEMFTYDADMEWDAGAPWYRPTRVHHVVSGGEYGWRQGTGKWPAWMPGGLPANLDIGLGSPTAVQFGTGAAFPAKYRRALFILEWAYGRILAVRLTPNGASYAAEAETFVKGRPLNVTDLAFGPDGHMYFITGGRKTQSGLYRVKYTAGDIDADQAESPAEAAARQTRAERRRLEALHADASPEAIDIAWDYLNSDDLWLRYAARVAIERQPSDSWRDKALAEQRVPAALVAQLALARTGDAALQARLLARWRQTSLEKLSAEHRLIALRTLEVCFVRMNPPDEATTRTLAAALAPLYPSEDERVDRLLCELLVYLNSPEVIEKTVALLDGPRSETEKLHYLFTLRHVKTGWTLEQRKTYFRWLRQARGFAGAQYIPRFVHYIEQDALANL